ncbi:MAG: YdeI/OmpD-associated family protein [Saprospiraceae bacterium]|nr:YdeI/OmpD-associated family protein [Saprospiraceae bacterium]
MQRFEAKLAIIDGNPYVSVPPEILEDLFVHAQRRKSPIPIQGRINKVPYRQTLVRFRGAWRLYVNMKMLKDSPRRVGECIQVELKYDPHDRSPFFHPKLKKGLASNQEAKAIFESLPPSRQAEIVRYIAQLKTEDSVERNVVRAVNFLLGKGRFVGRDHP